MACVFVLRQTSHSSFQRSICWSLGFRVIEFLTPELMYYQSHVPKRLSMARLMTFSTFLVVLFHFVLQGKLVC
jgi:hypothetical protein